MLAGQGYQRVVVEEAAAVSDSGWGWTALDEE
jgi:hypothetical protein